MLGKIKGLLLPSALCLSLLLSIAAIHAVFATGEAISAGSTATTELKTATSISGITINGTDNSTVPVKLLTTNGTLSMTTTTGLTFKDVNGNTLSNPQTGSTLYFSGARSDVNAALVTLKYLRNTTGTDTLEISLVNPGEVFFSGTNHLYEYVSSTLDWNGAKNAAAARTKYGATGYLTTITSQAENDFVSARLVNAGWMGASDVTTEGTWKWVTGPENGTTFCIGNLSCAVQPGQYVNWNNNEPNDSGSNEDCGQFLAGSSGKWNDLPCSGTTLPGYVVEYGTTGNLPSVAAANIAITTSDTAAPTIPGVPSAASPTTDTTPTVSWTASSDSGTGLKNPAYTLEWSTSATFASVNGSTTTNSTSLSPSLSDNTWYFRVKATDNANNIATSGISDPVVIDTAVPTKPGTPSAGVDWSNDNTPIFSWTASTDIGSGLAFVAYTVEWSQDTDFFGLGGVAGATENAYTIPDGLNMTDGTWYFRAKATDVLGHESAWSDYATIHIDTTVPHVSNEAATSGATQGQEIITWTSDKDTSSKVLYGPTASLGTSSSETDTSSRVKNHSVTLDGLVPCSIYHYTVVSADTAGNVATGSDHSFITQGCAGSADVVAHADTPITTGTGGDMSLDTIQVSVPSGFAAANADFQIKRINHDPALGATGIPSGMTLAGTKVYDIKALQDGLTAITSFNKPITITLEYADPEIAALIESSLAIYRWDAGMGWTKLSDCQVNAAANTVTCTTTHFSTFALYGAVKTAASTSSGAGRDRAGLAANPDQTTADQGNNNAAPTDDMPTTTYSDSPSNQAADDSQKTEGTSVSGWWWLLIVMIVGFGWWLLAARRRRTRAD